MSTLKDYENLFKRLELTELSVKDGDLELTLKKEPPKMCPPPPGPGFGPQPGIAAVAPVPSSMTTPETVPGAAQEAGNAGDKELHAIKSPLVGVFHAGEGADAKPYVNQGDKVKKGDIVCTVEAMKMFNDVTADQDGVIREICVTEGNLVEYGQILFRMDEV